jgi:hypothetical protein
MNTDVEVVDFDLDDDDVIDEDARLDPAPAPAPASHLRSTIAGDDAPCHQGPRLPRGVEDPNSSVPRDSRMPRGTRGHPLAWRIQCTPALSFFLFLNQRFKDLLQRTTILGVFSFPFHQKKIWVLAHHFAEWN